MLKNFLPIIIVFTPILLDTYLKFDRMVYGIISTIFGWIGSIVFIVLLFEMRG
jgi:hypothetical protein